MFLLESFIYSIVQLFQFLFVGHICVIQHVVYYLEPEHLYYEEGCEYDGPCVWKCQMHHLWYSSGPPLQIDCFVGGIADAEILP